MLVIAYQTGLNTKIPIILPIKGEKFINQGSKLDPILTRSGWTDYSSGFRV